MTPPDIVEQSRFLSRPWAEPRWPALLAIMTAGLLYAALPPYIAVGPRWLLFILVGLIELPALISLWRGFHRANQILGFIVSGLMTVFMIWSLVFLVMELPNHREAPLDMLRSAAILWVSNVLVFALWYWRLDGGGPMGRDQAPGHTEGAFLFPQMSWEITRGKWSPRFIDYLFLAFNTSTAFSPTDCAVLSRWAKVLCMIQSIISMGTVILLAARAVNIL